MGDYKEGEFRTGFAKFISFLATMGKFDQTLGTLIVGIFFNTYLYGIVTYQFAAYYRTKFEDQLWIRLSVLFLFIIDTFYSAAVVYMAWDYCVTEFDNPVALSVAIWPYTFTPIATALSAILTHFFLGFRIFRLTGSSVIYSVILVLSVATFGLGVACGVKAWIIKLLVDFEILEPWVTAWLSIQVGIDVMITIVLTHALYRSRTGFRKTDTVINRLMRGAIQTGVFAGIFSLGGLIGFAASPKTNLYGMFVIPIGRVYTATLMDTLTSREELKGILASREALESPSYGNAIWSTNLSMIQPSNNINLHKIHVKTEVFTDASTTPEEPSREQSDDSPVFVKDKEMI